MKATTILGSLLLSVALCSPSFGWWNSWDACLGWRSATIAVAPRAPRVGPAAMLVSRQGFAPGSALLRCSGVRETLPPAGRL